MSAPTRRRLPRILVAVAAVLAVVGGIALHQSAASAATPVYPVMNTSEYSPDGVYFRASPNWNDAVVITGYGIYAGERVQLQCWAPGTNVQRRDGGSNTVWYIANNVSRPTVAGRTNSGWLNAHFVADGTGPGQVAPGVVRCGSTPPPAAQPPSAPQQLPDGGAVYFQPRWSKDDPYPTNPNVVTLARDKWSAGNCSTDRVDDNIPAVVNGHRVTTMGGWSVGRLGPIYLIKQNFPLAKQFNFIILYDPGSYANFFTQGSCDTRFDESGLIAQWLRANPNNVLMILAGHDTYDPNWQGKGSHQGIQRALFNGVRDNNLSRQVYVCNYNTMGHPQVLSNFQGMMGQPKTTSCPQGVRLWQPHPDPYNLNWHQ